jgi:periplasmic divalent cation tolerance protein
MHSVVLITAKDLDEARRIARHVVERKLAACVNIISPISSIFHWEGKIEEASEALLMLKTEQKLLDPLIREVKSVHSYDVPEIIALPIVGGYDKYLQWVSDSTKI